MPIPVSVTEICKDFWDSLIDIYRKFLPLFVQAKMDNIQRMLQRILKIKHALNIIYQNYLTGP